MLNKDELIQKFLNNSCNDEEMRLVMELIKAEPNLIEEMLSKSEWDDIDTSLPMKPRVEDEMRKKIFSKTRKPIRKMLKSVLAAAAILGGLALGLFIFDVYRNKADVQTGFTDHQPTVSNTEIIENKTLANREIMLADNSTVSLFPGSSIEYNRDFVGNRTIQLKGKAIFSVTKLLESPFVVFSGAIRTTALGTRFLVDNLDPDKQINVKLYQGKVVVQAIEEMTSMEKTFLDAGEQCFVDMQTMQVQVKPLFTSKNNSSLVQNSATGKSKKANEVSFPRTNEMLHFSKTRMPEVFEKLQKVFNRPIKFNTDEVDERYFTGSFSLNDSLSVILRMLSVTSDLKISLNDDGIIVVQNLADQPGIDSGDSIVNLGLDAKMKLDDLAPEPEFVREITTIKSVPEIVVVSENEISYNRISLPDLLQELQKKTKKTIHFKREELQDINFTGSILFDVNMRNTLSMICRINGLTLQVKQGSFYITKDK